MTKSSVILHDWVSRNQKAVPWASMRRVEGGQTMQWKFKRHTGISRNNYISQLLRKKISFEAPFVSKWTTSLDLSPTSASKSSATLLVCFYTLRPTYWQLSCSFRIFLNIWLHNELNYNCLSLFSSAFPAASWWMMISWANGWSTSLSQEISCTFLS